MSALTRFTTFAEISYTFSKAVHKDLLPILSLDPVDKGVTGPLLPGSKSQMAQPTSSAGVRTLTGRWSFEILRWLLSHGRSSFEEIRIGLGGMSTRTLSARLTSFERVLIIRRRVLRTRPPRTSYVLTEQGANLAKLAQPMWVYMGFITNVETPHNR
jgi:DNA-binding HxlR family transcriptional regulator